MASDLIQDGLLEIGDGYRAKNAELADSGLPFARAGNLRDGFDFDGADRFPEAGLARVGAKISRPGDVVFTSKGTVGRFAFVTTSTERFVFSPQLCYWRSLDVARLVPSWLYYWLQGPGAGQQFRELKGQTDMADYVSLRDQRAMRISVPSPDEQRAVVEVLSAIDAKVTSNWRLVLRHETARRIRFRHLYAIAPRRPLHEAAIAYKRSVLPSRTPDATFEQFSIPAFDDGSDPEVCSGATMASGKTRLPPEPSVLISKLNPRTPRIWVPTGSGMGPAVCSPEFVVLLPRAGTPHSWVEAAVRFDRLFYAEVLASVTGTTGSRQRVKPGDVLAASVPTGDAQQIEEWDRFADPLLRRDAALIRERRTLTRIRDELLPKLVSGQIRVPLSNDEDEMVGAALEAAAAP